MRKDDGFEFPENPGELSAYALDHSIEALSEALRDHPDPDVAKALAVIRFVAHYPRQAPWYGVHVKLPDRDDSVTVGTILYNAFEAVGDDVDALGEGGRVLNTRKSWFTQMYAQAWRQGKIDYYDFLDHLIDPVRWEKEDREGRLTSAQADAEYARISRFLRERP